jgi:hypothetical protein
VDEARRINLQSLIDDAKCCEARRAVRWPEGVRLAALRAKRPSVDRNTLNEEALQQFSAARA